jgi:hypothetical protein
MVRRIILIGGVLIISAAFWLCVCAYLVDQFPVVALALAWLGGMFSAVHTYIVDGAAKPQ